MLVLAGDVGATNMRLMVARIEDNKQETVVQKKYHCIEYKSFAEIICKFLQETGQDLSQFTSACFAIAGPIEDGKAKFTNLPWSIDLALLRAELKIEKMVLINDFQAVGNGVSVLQNKDLYVLQDAKPQPNGLRVLVGAGTGLGVGFIYWNGSEYVVSPTEGGHVNFAPGDGVQMGLLKFLLRKYHRVSVERLLSGHGIENIYSYFADLADEKENPELRLAIHRGDAAAAITEFAIKHKDPLATRAVDTFVRIYGSFVGDLAYTFLPYGGIYVAGGIAPKILDQLTDGRFMQAFLDKGRLFRILTNIPLYIVLDTDVGLKGAAAFAARLI